MSNAVAVIGGGGFLGSYLSRELLNAGYHVLSIGRRKFSEIDIGRRELLKGSEYRSVNVADSDSLRRILVEAAKTHSLLGVINLAWSGVERLSDNDVAAQFGNISACCESLNIAIDLGVKKFIFAGSMEEVFAKLYTGLDYRNSDKQNRHVVYALAKYYCRSSLKALARQRKYNGLTCNTNSHVMGLHDDKDSFLQVLVRTLVEDRSMDTSTGEQLFDVIHVTDCAAAYRAVLEKGLLGHDYWIGSGDPQELSRYMKTIGEITGKADKINYGYYPFRDVKLRMEDFDTTDLTEHCAFKPEKKFDDMVSEMIGHFKK